MDAKGKAQPLATSKKSIEASSEVIFVTSCRACPSNYNFELNPITTVTVLCGRPPISSVYKAVSYLWELQHASTVHLKCIKCAKLKSVPMRDATKLKRILDFVSGGGQTSCNIWLDALSIDQDDPGDLNEQLGFMGDIYRKAETVAVLLPRGDEGAYEKLRALVVAADAVVKHHAGESGFVKVPNYSDKLAEISESYLMSLESWTDSLHMWRYWKRAWTFQEWAMASELEIACESTSNNEIVQNIKNIITMGASIIGSHKNTETLGRGLTSENLPEVLRIREETASFLTKLRLHFPMQDALPADNELEGDELRKQTFITASGSAIDSGTFITISPPGEKPLSTRAMLSLALNAINTSDRTAGYEADLVACWASMCNISYDYNRHDTFPIALHKVLTALRKDGMRIYSFQVNTIGGETDLTFLKYAAAMKQSNSPSGGLMFGSPVFTGRADTLTHLLLSLEGGGDLMLLHSSFDVTLQEVENSVINEKIPFIDRDRIILALETLVSGKANGERLQDVIPLIRGLMNEIPHEQLQSHCLVTVSIAVKDNLTMNSFNAWAICPSDTNIPNLFLVRESLNGTLVLAAAPPPESINAEEAQIVAYLNMTHQRDGTYLIKSDEEGVVDIVFRARDTRLLDLSWMTELMAGMGEMSLLGLGVMDSVDDRMFEVKIDLGSRVFKLANNE